MEHKEPDRAALDDGEQSSDLAALLSRTREYLSELATGLKLRGVSKLAKSELARRILAARSAPEPAPAPPEARPLPASPRRKGPASRRPTKAPPAAAPSPSPVPGAAPVEPPSPVAAAKLALGPAAPAEPRPENIPWSYDQNRVTAMAVDPETLYVYWEVTDPAMAQARSQLGAGGEAAWLDLRVYDTSGLIFDGTNAHSFFDHGVGRSDRQWFFTIGKPSSSAVVEVGMRSPEGAFARVARSSRVDFPRIQPVPWSDPEWMTVLSTGDVFPAGRGAPARPAGPPPVGAAGGPGRAEHVPVWILLEPGEGERRFRELFGEAFERIEWHEEHGAGWYELQGRLEWQVGPIETSWEAGPFSYPVQVEPPSVSTWQGGAIAYTANGVTRVVYGPWRVVIRNLDARSQHAVLGQWQIYRSFMSRGGVEELQRVSWRVAAAPGGASERVAASGWAWGAGSELRLGGASELWRLSASEVRLGGASEVLLAGASERRLAGASERRLAGASEWRLAGASEYRLAGASEYRLAGASEYRLGGASERRLGGASEYRLGASERRLGGASERLVGSGEVEPGQATEDHLRGEHAGEGK